MSSSHLSSLYAFANVAIFAGGLWLVLKVLGRIFGSRRSKDISRPREPHVDVRLGTEPQERRSRPGFVPPPPPSTDREYWQAEQYCFDHRQPPPLPPPRQERDEW